MLIRAEFYPRANWDDIYLFLKVVEGKSFRQGAIDSGAALNTVRSAVERLEYQSGAKLLTRDVQGVLLTCAGEELYGIAKQIEAVLEKAANLESDDGDAPLPPDNSSDSGGES